ncbi:MAG: DUF547 domain-containing protein [Bryobacterales bacterium]
MTTPIRFLAIALLLAPAALAADLDHSSWNALLQRDVTPESRVDYQALHEKGLGELDAYLAQLAGPWPADMDRAAVKAALINAYNALTVRWILSHYPIESIWKTGDPFQAPRHTVNGEQLSLDQVEGRLREMGDPRIHAAVVCAARSCPPLRREAYIAERVDEQLDDNTRQWLANPRLNEFLPADKTARVSQIFSWYEGDFAASGGVPSFLAQYAPADAQAFLREPSAVIEYQTYNWGLNDAGALGGSYSQLSFYLDWVRGGYAYSAAKDWFLSLGKQYGVNPVIFGSIYVGAIPFFSLSIAWLIRNLRRGRSPVAPILCASFFFVSAYLYLLIAGKNIPLWVYVFLGAMIAFGVYSTVRKVKSGISEGSS